MTCGLVFTATASLVLGVSVLSAQRADPPPQTARSLPIVVYHEIRVSGDTPPDGQTAISLQRFESEMHELKAQGYTTLSMDEVVRFLKGDPFPGKVVAVHLDDGWKSGLAAVPVLNALGFKATFWIIPGAGIGDPDMDWDDIQALVRNPHFDVYSHTLSHPWKENDTLLDWLAGRTPGKGLNDIKREFTESRRLLEEKLGRPITYLAWPRGLYNDTLIAMARDAGYTALLTTDDGVNAPGTDLLHIQRTMVHGKCGMDTFRQILLDGKYRECVN